jgi:hypothetical protein
MLSQKLRLQISLLIYLILLALLLSIKPSIFYTEDGKIKSFGTGKKLQSIFPLWMAILVLAIFAFYLSHIVIVMI